jgi:ankyrin repeat protein
MFKKNKKRESWISRAGTLLLILTSCLAVSIFAAAGSMDDDLIQAARNNDIDALDALIGKGANVNATGPLLSTPLIAACKAGNTACVQALLKAGADINVKCIRECTPLMWSADYGWTPLMKATYRDNAEIVKLLVDKGANVNAKNFAGHSILFIAEELNRQPEIIQMLANAGATR